MLYDILFTACPILDFIFSPDETLAEAFHLYGNVDIKQLGYTFMTHSPELILDSAIAVKYSKSKSYSMMYFGSNPSFILTSGTPWERLQQAFDYFGREFTQELQDQVNSCIEEITKEEYEALITYKPE